MKINCDYLWLERQAWIEKLQARHNPWVDVMPWCLLGMVVTGILLVWQGGEP